MRVYIFLLVCCVIHSIYSQGGWKPMVGNDTLKSEYYFFPKDFDEGNIHAMRLYEFEKSQDSIVYYTEPKNKTSQLSKYKVGDFTFNYANIYKMVYKDSILSIHYSDILLLNHQKDSLILKLNTEVGDSWLGNSIDSITLVKYDTLSIQGALDSIKTFKIGDKFLTLSKNHGITSYSDFKTPEIGVVEQIGYKTFQEKLFHDIYDSYQVSYNQRGYGICNLQQTYIDLCFNDKLVYEDKRAAYLSDNPWHNQYSKTVNSKGPFMLQFSSETIFGDPYSNRNETMIFEDWNNFRDADDLTFLKNYTWFRPNSYTDACGYYLSPMRLKRDGDQYELQISSDGSCSDIWEEYLISTPVGVLEHWDYSGFSYSYFGKLISWENCGTTLTQIPEIEYQNPIVPYDYTLSIASTNEQKSISFYPNPSQDIIEIDSYNNLESVAIYSVKGSLIASHNAVHKIDLSELPSQIYIIQFTFTDGEVVSQRLIKL